MRSKDGVPRTTPERDLSRRTFVRGAAAAGVAAGTGLLAMPTWATAATAARLPSRTLSGSEFDLRIGGTEVNITGKRRTALTVNGSLPGPTLRWREGDDVTLRVTNDLDEDTSIHWHGIVLPANMDGVPGFSFSGIRPGETFTYRFRVRQSGTYWYHSHSGFQEQLGVYGALIIDPMKPDGVDYDREHVVILSDWSDEDPSRIFAKLKKESHYYNLQQRTIGDFIRDIGRDGLGATLSERLMWGRMRMSATDLADVTGSTYTYLLNGMAPEAGWTGLFRPGERILLRFINAAGASYFDVRIPGVRMTVVAADGQPIHPVPVDEFRIAIAETFDVLVEPSGAEAFTIFAQAMDRSGYAAGTLTVVEGLRAPIPAMDPRPVLTMADMGHDHQSDGHAGHGTMTTDLDPHAGHGGSHGAPAAPIHPRTEFGNPLVDMRTQAPTSRLDDPGIGLRNNGRNVLTYADLHSAFTVPDDRPPGRTIEIHLTGHMGRFVWSFDGVTFDKAEPIRLIYGERVRFVLVNDTMMAHPIHLHGMWSDMEDDEGNFLVRKHTIDMPPGSRRSFLVTVDALGRWAFHCHLLYHMEAGMFREVRVEEGAPA